MFATDDHEMVSGIVNDLAESGLLFRSGRGPNTLYQVIAMDEALGSQQTRQQELSAFVWTLVYRIGPISKESLQRHLPMVSDALLVSLIGGLEKDGRIARVDQNSHCITVLRGLRWQLPLDVVHYWRGKRQLFVQMVGKSDTPAFNETFILKSKGKELVMEQYGQINLPDPFGYSKLEFPGHFIAIAGERVWEFENPENKPGALDIPLDRSFGYESTRDFYFISGANDLGTNIVRIDPFNNEIKELLPVGSVRDR